MSSDFKVLQVIPKLGYGGAETGCFDIAHYLSENNCKSFIVTSGGELLKFVDKKKVKVFRLPVNSKNPILILINAIILIGIILFNNINNGFLLCTGSLKTFTFFLSTNLSNSPPLVTIKDLQLFSGK